MRALMKPAVAIMNRLRYSAKFTLIFIVMLVPLLILSGIAISDINKEIHFLLQERLGVKYIQAIRGPVELIQQHRGMTAAYLNGNTHFEGRIMAKRKKLMMPCLNLSASIQSWQMI